MVIPVDTNAVDREAVDADPVEMESFSIKLIGVLALQVVSHFLVQLRNGTLHSQIIVV